MRSVSVEAYFQLFRLWFFHNKRTSFLARIVGHIVLGVGRNIPWTSVVHVRSLAVAGVLNHPRNYRGIDDHVSIYTSSQERVHCTSTKSRQSELWTTSDINRPCMIRKKPDVMLCASQGLAGSRLLESLDVRRQLIVLDATFDLDWSATNYRT